MEMLKPVLILSARGLVKFLVTGMGAYLKPLK
jgi:hypothetical protein